MQRCKVNGNAVKLSLEMISEESLVKTTLLLYTV